MDTTGRKATSASPVNRLGSGWDSGKRQIAAPRFNRLSGTCGIDGDVVVIATADLNQPASMEFVMKLFSLCAAVMVAGVLIAAPVYAQQAPTKQKTDGDGLTQVGPGSKAYKQKTDGDGLTQVGPGSKAYKQKTDGDGLTQVGPGSKAYKQKTQSFSHANGSPVGIAKQN
jgi:hypothetical protein